MKDPVIDFDQLYFIWRVTWIDGMSALLFEWISVTGAEMRWGIEEWELERFAKEKEKEKGTKSCECESEIKSQSLPSLQQLTPFQMMMERIDLWLHTAYWAI